MRTVGCSPRTMTKPDGASRPMRGAQPLIRRWCGATAPSAAHRQGIRAACVKFQSYGGWVRPGLMRRSRLVAVQATEETKSSGIKRTLADLDSLLGIEEEPKKEDKKDSVESGTDITMSAAWMKEVVDTEIEMLEQELGKTLDKEKKKEFQKRLTSQMEQIVEQAKKMKEGEAESPSDAVFQQEVRQLQQMFDEDVGVSREDLSKIKETVGSSRMYITESRIIGDTELLEGWCNVQQEDRGCAIIRGNMRDTPQAILADLSAKVDERFNGRYKVFLIPDVTEDMQEQQGQRRGALKILPAGLAQPRSTSWLAYLLAFFCALLALFTTFQLGVIAASPLLPKETAQFISNPDNLNLLWEQPDLVPPGLPGLSEDLPASWWATTTNVAMAVGASQLVGDLARQVTAGTLGLKMGPTFIVPSLDLGLFGSAQPIKSTIASNRQLWSLAASGPTAAGLVAFTLFIVGFLLSMDPANLGDAAVPLPSFLRQGSLLLGAITNALANGDGQIMVHPLLIGGFVGMYAVALNLLPIGSLAGGRMMQASFGRNGQAVASFLVYIGLGFGLLGSFVSLPFGLYVLCFQRLGERHIQDTLTEVGDQRATLTLVFVLLSILILFPFDPVVLTNMDTVGGIVGPDQL